MKKLTKLTTSLKHPVRFGFLAVLLAVCFARSPLAHADAMLLASTDLVTGTSGATFSFDAPTSGTVTAQLAPLAWPVPLNALSFSATTASQTLDSWTMSSPSTTPYVGSFQVGSGTYFAHVMATAGGSLDIGLYSLLLTFKPSAVPLPATDWTLLAGVFMLFGFARLWAVFTPFSAFKQPKGARGALGADAPALTT